MKWVIEAIVKKLFKSIDDSYHGMGWVYAWYEDPNEPGTTRRTYDKPSDVPTDRPIVFVELPHPWAGDTRYFPFFWYEPGMDKAKILLQSRAMRVPSLHNIEVKIVGRKVTIKTWLYSDTPEDDFTKEMPPFKPEYPRVYPA